VEIPYKIAADTMNDITNHVVDYAVHNPALAVSMRKQGKWRILGIGASERLKSVPDLPTMTELGIPMNVVGWRSATVPAGTPRPIVDQINTWFNEVLATDETKAFLANIGGDAFINTPDQAQALLLKDIENWHEYVKIAKITPLG
jgi:tripartite-type tricarboxylate transporter receptor subunit TctC